MKKLHILGSSNGQASVLPEIIRTGRSRYEGTGVRKTQMATQYRKAYVPVTLDEDNIVGKLSDERFMKMSKGYEEEQRTLQAEADTIQNELQQEEKKSVDVKRFLATVKKYTDLTELTPEILREFVDKIIVHAPDKSSGRRLQEIEIIYNHIGEFDHSKVTLWKGNAV